MHQDSSAAGPIWAFSEYLKAHHPTFCAIQTGLAVLGFLVLVRFALRRSHSWVTSFKNSSPSSSESSSTLSSSPLPHWASTDEKIPFFQPPSNNNMSNLGTELPIDQDTSAAATTTAATRQQAPFSQGRPPVLSIQTSGENLHRHFLTRLPPAPPLTPPELSSTIFSSEDRLRNLENFMHQPNPDYMSETSTVDVQSTGFSSPVPRRRSYMKSMAIGVPTPQHSTLSSSEFFESGHATFSPGSYPPMSPLLPPAPPTTNSEPTATTFKEDDSPHRNVGIQGEIISVLDNEGAGWTRHTRVYGGGACQACQASGDKHGSGGGFYGANVRPEEMRH